MDVLVGFAEFDALATPFDVRVGWAEFDALAAPFSVCVGWAEFDNQSDAVAVPPYFVGGALTSAGFHRSHQSLSRYHSRSGRNYTIPVELAPGADESAEEDAVMALLLEIAARELV